MAPLLAGALLLGGWVVLGELGRRYAPLWAGGLLPLAVWLGAAGATARAARQRRATARAALALVCGAAVGTTAALAVVVLGGGGGVALCLAAVCWGVGLGAASAAAVPVAGQGGLAGLLQCALPLSRPAGWPAASAWGLLAARWSMLPMMATLGLMESWCGAAGGLASADWVVLHLLAMLLPVAILAALRVQLRDGVWAATAMAAAGLALCCAPDLRGLMLASCAQAVGWGLAGATRRPLSAAPPATRERQGIWAVGCPAVLLLALGLALDRYGPVALGFVQASLSLVGAAAFAIRVPRLGRRMSPSANHGAATLQRQLPAARHWLR